jgi:hypothetical protein
MTGPSIRGCDRLAGEESEQSAVIDRQFKVRRGNGRSPAPVQRLNVPTQVAGSARPALLGLPQGS